MSLGGPHRVRDHLVLQSLFKGHQDHHDKVQKNFGERNQARYFPLKHGMGNRKVCSLGDNSA